MHPLGAGRSPTDELERKTAHDTVYFTPPKPSLTTPITPKGDKTDPNNPVTPPVSDGVGTVVGSARQIRNLTVNIEAFNKGGINTANTTLQHMEPNQIEEWFIDMCMRVVRSIETTY